MYLYSNGSTLFLTICFSRTSPFPAELCIAERQLDFGGGGTDFQIYDVFDVTEIYCKRIIYSRSRFDFPNTLAETREHHHGLIGLLQFVICK
jgi:hypothetical protein